MTKFKVGDKVRDTGELSWGFGVVVDIKGSYSGYPIRVDFNSEGRDDIAYTLKGEYWKRSSEDYDGIRLYKLVHPADGIDPSDYEAKFEKDWELKKND